VSTLLSQRLDIPLGIRSKLAAAFCGTEIKGASSVLVVRPKAIGDLFAELCVSPICVALALSKFRIALGSHLWSLPQIIDGPSKNTSRNARLRHYVILLRRSE